MRMLLLPLEGQFSMGRDAVFQVEVDQILISNPRLLREPLKIGDTILIQPNGDLLLQALGIWILDGF